MTQFDKNPEDPIQQKIDQIKHLYTTGKQLNAGNVWHLTMEISRFGETATVCLFPKSGNSGQAIMQTTVHIRPEKPLKTDIEHRNFQENLREHLNGLIALVQNLTGAHAPSPDPVTEQSN